MIQKNNPVKRFGEIAIDKGFATKSDVDKALAHQKDIRKKGENELIGIIMLKLGLLSNEQLIDILKYYDHGDQ
ncbi:hypothetical protein ACFL4W_01750 [Planctomycetota bacterium]